MVYWKIRKLIFVNNQSSDITVCLFIVLQNRKIWPNRGHTQENLLITWYDDKFCKAGLTPLEHIKNEVRTLFCRALQELLIRFRPESSAPPASTPSVSTISHDDTGNTPESICPIHCHLILFYPFSQCPLKFFLLMHFALLILQYGFILIKTSFNVLSL